MSNIAKAFDHGKAFIPFITCGDPSLEITEQLVLAMAESGADLIELGIPFSDPTAEGPVIQAASQRALAGGVTTDKIFEMVRRLRQKTNIPMVFMTYANVVFSYGADQFLGTASRLGIDGIILPDLPYEEKGEIASYARENGVDIISLIAPTSKERIQMIASEAEGFIYVVSSLGVTGMRSEIKTDLNAIIEDIRDVTDIPVAVGFGINTPKQAENISKIADGVIVGSAIVKIIEEHGENAADALKEYVSSMSKACNK